jgi:hypothetical protein
MRRRDRVVLIHWKAAEAPERLERLRAAGYEPESLPPKGTPALRALREDPPAAFIIDLDRLPLQGGAVAVALRQQTATRRVPIVFAGGHPDKVARVRSLLPDGVYTEWPQMKAALRTAIGHPPAAPVVPGTMEAYSGTPLVKKLGIKPGATLALLDAPESFADTLGALPEGVKIQATTRGAPRLILLFARSRADLERRLYPTVRALGEGGLWIIWPKKTSQLAADLNGNDVRRLGLDAGLVDYKVCAIDENWSGLLFTRRRAKP